MDKLKKFFMYALLIIAFYIFSQIMISFAINTRYSEIESKSNNSDVIVFAKAAGVAGIANVRILGIEENAIEGKYIKLDCYSKDNILLGTKYIETGKVEKGNYKDYEIRFNYTRVKKVEADLVDTIPEETPEEDRKSDEKMQGAILLSAVILLCFM